MNKYHSGKFCPVINGMCRHDCVSLISMNHCSMFDDRAMILFTLNDIAHAIKESNEQKEPGINLYGTN